LLQAKHSKKNEKHIFYRGLGLWEGPLSVRSNTTHLILQNLEDQPIEATWVLSRKGERGYITRVPSIPSKGLVVVSTEGIDTLETGVSYQHMTLQDYVTSASVSLEVELTRAGLFELEARAMVETWSNSYFKNSGSRVLYIAPKKLPDVLLPWTIKPTPSQETRVLVGRVEVILESEEKILKPIVDIVLGHYAEGSQGRKNIELMLKKTKGYPKEVSQAYDYIFGLGRFAEPKIRRVLENSQWDSQLVEDWVLAALTF